VENSHPRRASNHHASGAQRSGRWPHGARHRRPPASTAPRLASGRPGGVPRRPKPRRGPLPAPSDRLRGVRRPDLLGWGSLRIRRRTARRGPGAAGAARAHLTVALTWVCPAWSSGRGSPRRDTRRYCRTAAGGRRHPWPLRSRGAQSRRAPWACPAVGGTARGRVGLDRRSGAPNAGRIDEHLAPPPDYFTVSPRLRRDLLGPVWCSGAPAGTGPRCHLRDHYSRARTADGRRR
jgi:hypothetical protein